MAGIKTRNLTGGQDRSLRDRGKLGMARLFSAVLGTSIAVAIFFQGFALASATPMQITTDPANQGRPDVRGNIIVWKDNRNGNWDIYMYDLATETEQAVSTNPAYQNVPVTNGSLVFWQDDRAGTNNNDIYFKSVISGTEQLLVSGPGNQGLPVVNGTKLVYVDDHNGNNDIYAIDLVSRDITPVCTNPANQWQPRIDGTRVVWEDNRNGNWDIYTYDLSTGVEEPVSLSSGDDRVADIDGNLVVWQRNTGGVYDIWMKDLLTEAVTPVTNDTAYQSSPRVSGDVIVWENYDYSLANWDVYMKDLTSNGVSPLAGGLPTEARPAIDRETAVWEATGPTGYDIWMVQIPDTVSPSITAETPANGSTAGCASPVISAAYSDNRAGIDTGSVTLSLDGQDVTAAAQVTGTGVSFEPVDQLSDGAHSASVAVSDLSGNTKALSWEFFTETPELSLSLTDSYWASLEDYASRDLTVSFLLRNVSETADANYVEVLNSTATAGVVLTSPMPAYVADLSPGTGQEMVLRYRVPAGVYSFKATVYVGCYDVCGRGYNFPGPPPGS